MKKISTVLISSALSLTMVMGATTATASATVLSSSSTPQTSYPQDDAPESGEFVAIEDAEAAKRTHAELQKEGTPSQQLTHNGETYTKFELEDGVSLTLPDFDSENHGNQGAIEVESQQLQATVLEEGYRLASISPKVKRAIVASGIALAAYLIGGPVGAIVGGGVGSYLGENGVCYGNKNLNVYQEKRWKSLPFHIDLNSKQVFRCE
ncbi:hypothetical protein [Corynebacterium casei]|uniref:hypothetical protein n=1 Tax=Corynebacterium casei TaxID=160386 RepID=UPI003F8DF68D